MKTVNVKHGWLLATGAFVCWGLFPLYFGMLHGVESMHVLAHRAVWSGALSLVLLLAWLRDEFTSLRASGALLATLKHLALTAALLGFNWGIYIWAIHAGHVLESSLGYFINPLVSVLLGVVFLRERLSLVNRVGVGLATVAVAILSTVGGGFPMVAVMLALSFGSYGLLRKKLKVNPLLASCLEALLMMPVGALYLLITPTPVFPSDAGVSALLLLCGVVTLVPLLLFNLGAQSMKYSSLGLIQYLTPTLQFACAVLSFHEPVSRTHLLAFGLIWTALALSSADALRGFLRSHPLLWRKQRA